MTIYFWNSRLLILDQNLSTLPHIHHYVEIIISIEGTFRILIEDNWIETDAILLDKDVSHQLTGSNREQVVLLLEPETITAEALKNKFLCESSIFTLDKLVQSETKHALKNLSHPTATPEEANRTLALLIKDILGIPPTNKLFDPRVKRVLAELRSSPEKKNIRELSRLVHISESRLMHLFKEEVGIPIRQYILWARLMKAVNAIVAGNSFTHAAHEVNFADSAHLSRTFKRMFGKTLTEVFGSSKNISIITCED